MSSTLLSCTLCGLEISSKALQEGDEAFCCHGCQTVFRLLAAKNQLDNYQNHPIFQQAVRSGLISNPCLLETIQRNQLAFAEQDMQRLQIEIQDMWCPSCAEVIRLLLLQEKGVKQCVVDYATDLALIEYAPRYIAKDVLFKLISQMGYRPVSLEDANKHKGRFHLYLRFVVAAFFSLNIMMFAYPLYSTYFSYDEQDIGTLFAWLSLFASLPVATYSAWPILRRFFNSLKLGLFGMETLVVLGITSSFVISIYELYHGGNKVYFDSMTVIIAFMLLGKMIESKAKYSAKETLHHLHRALPKRARKRFPDGKQDFVSLKQVGIGDVLVVLTGEKVVLDGVVVEGDGSCDESLVTGEAFPLFKQKEALVIAGTVLTEGWLAYRVVSREDNSTLKQIVSLVEQGIGRKSQYTRAADNIVRWFVPVVIVIAIAAGLYSFFYERAYQDSQRTQEAFIRAISVLLISCPCAIGIAAPLAESHLLNALAKQGVIVRNRGCLKDLGNETVFIFDKTGTVTQGNLSVINGLEELSTPLKSILKAMASYSNHPVAAAIFRAIEAPHASLDQVKEYPGKGIMGLVKGKNYYIGSEIFLRQMGYPSVKADFTLPKEGVATIVYFGTPEGAAFPFLCADLVKAEIKPLLENLHPAEAILLSGDSHLAVQSAASACGFKKFFWHRNPLQKQDFIADLRQKGEVVCMIGDGVNDAPALSAAQIGLSVLSAADISIQVSDIFFTTDKLSILPDIRYLAKKAKRIIQQNLFWAFFYNVMGIGLAFFGWLSPLFAAFAMTISSFIVIINAQRLSKTKPLKFHQQRETDLLNITDSCEHRYVHRS
jgi:heavy metal translocating P-type ATPase